MNSGVFGMIGIDNHRGTPWHEMNHSLCGVLRIDSVMCTKK